MRLSQRHLQSKEGKQGGGAHAAIRGLPSPNPLPLPSLSLQRAATRNQPQTLNLAPKVKHSSCKSVFSCVSVTGRDEEDS